MQGFKVDRVNVEGPHGRLTHQS